MNKFKGLLGRTKSLSARGGSRSSANDIDDGPADSPEANILRSIRLFCESGSTSNADDEVLHLPVIVESAESSPTAAASAANQIKKYLQKEWSTKPSVQYSATMLLRILSDNPGPQFTKNFDKSFVSTVKECLRNCRDQSTQQILRETLDHLENEKAYDEGLLGLFQMWRKEKGTGASFSQAGQRHSYMPPNGFQQPYQGGYERSGASGRVRMGASLPPAAELASRVEEAKNTAKILLQLVQSTPSEELVNNELIKEFSGRCQTAQGSMQTYINASNPVPDPDTAQTLIETNEQLSLAISRYQRAILAARRAMGASPSPQQNQQGTQQGYGAFAAPAGPPPAQQQLPGNNQAYSHNYQPPTGPPPSGNTVNRTAPAVQQQNDPFADPEPRQYGAFQAPQQQQGHHPQTVSFDDFDRQQQPYQHSRAFTIEKGPTFAAPNRRDTNELENAYSSDQPKVSPVETRDDHVSPSSQRPAWGPYHQSDITQSYVGRQQSAANGLIMSGAGGAQTPYEQAGGYNVSPVDTKR